MWRLLFLLFSFSSLAQVQFQQALKPLQLVPRLDAHSGSFTWKLTISQPSATHLSLTVLADGQLYTHSKQVVSLSQREFQFPVTLQAKPQEYSFRFFIHVGGDSTLVHSVDRVVCGDFIALYGQSNMVAQADYDAVLASVDDRLLRNFTFNQDIYQLNQLTWFPSKQPYGHTGGIGLNLQKRILQETGIPTCIINGAQGGASINQLFDRNSQNPTDLSTTYGRFIARMQQAGAKGHVRAFLWRQGENELCGNPGGVIQYPQRFTSLYQAIQNDIDFNGHFYNVQLAIQSCFSLEEGGLLRDWIRRTPLLFPRMRAVTAIGIPIYDGAHHDRQGHEKLTNEIYRLLRGDVYNLTVLPEEHFPTVQRIERHNDGHRLDLVFQENQRFIIPNDSVILNRVWKIADQFFINQVTSRTEPSLVESVTQERNRIILHLKKSVNSGFVTYLPSFLTTDPPFIGALLSNRLGRRALSFYQLPIHPPLLPPHLDSVWYQTTGTHLFVQSLPDFSLEAQRLHATGWETFASSTEPFLIDNYRCKSPGLVSYRFRWVAGENTSEWSKIFQLPCHPEEILEPNTGNLEEGPPWAKRIRSREKIGRDGVWQFQNSLELLPGFSVSAGFVFQTQRFTMPPVYFPK